MNSTGTGIPAGSFVEIVGIDAAAGRSGYITVCEPIQDQDDATDEQEHHYLILLSDLPPSGVGTATMYGPAVAIVDDGVVAGDYVSPGMDDEQDSRKGYEGTHFHVVGKYGDALALVTPAEQSTEKEVRVTKVDYGSSAGYIYLYEGRELTWSWAWPGGPRCSGCRWRRSRHSRLRSGCR